LKSRVQKSGDWKPILEKSPLKFDGHVKMQKPRFQAILLLENEIIYSVLHDFKTDVAC